MRSLGKVVKGPKNHTTTDIPFLFNSTTTTTTEWIGSDRKEGEFMQKRFQTQRERERERVCVCCHIVYVARGMRRAGRILLPLVIMKDFLGDIKIYISYHIHTHAPSATLCRCNQIRKGYAGPMIQATRLSNFASRCSLSKTATPIPVQTDPGPEFQNA